MKNIIRNIKILSCLFLLFFYSENVIGQEPLITNKLMNFNKASSFVKEHGVKVQTNLSNWSVEIEVETNYDLLFEYYTSCNYDLPSDLKLFSGKLLLYGIMADQNTPNNYSNSSYKHEALYPNEPNYGLTFFRNYCERLNGSDTKKFYQRNALAAKFNKAEYGVDDSWLSFTNIHGLVEIKIILSPGLQLNDIEEIKIPGIAAFSGLDFEPDLKIEVYREFENVPTYTFSYMLNEPDRELNLTVGDSVVFKSKHDSFEFQGLEEVWLARSGGESKYYSTKNVNPGEIKPFIGFDAQVHGVALRKYPEDHIIQHPDLTYNSTTGEYSWYWIAQRRTDKDKNYFDPEENNETLDKFKHASNFGITKFNVGGGQSVTSQRNNQREGYNMQYLKSFKDLNNNYLNYDQDHFILGLDGDELVFLDSQYAEVNQNHQPTAILEAEVEEWKIVPADELEDPIIELVEAYRKNRSYKLNLPLPEDFYAYEILDKNLYIKNSTSASLSKRAFNYKDYVLYNSVVTRDDDNIKAPGALFKFLTNNEDIEIKLNVEIPVPSLDFGFDAIEGEQWPAETQKNVSYSYKVPNNLLYGRYIMEYTHENELGMLEKDTRYYTPTNSNNSPGGIDFTEQFDMKGWGYNEITVYFQRHPNAQKVMIAGKELLEVNLRFMSVPNGNSGGYVDFSQTPFDGLKLNEGRGEGKYWYLRDFNDDPNAALEYGNRNYAFRKEYTIQEGDELYLTVMDSDPHTFIHYKDEFYLSERTMAKRLLDSDINDRVTWYYHKEGFPDDKTEVGTGRTYATSATLEPGNYIFTASYNGAINYPNADSCLEECNYAIVSTKVKVLPFNYLKNDFTTPKGIINLYDLSPIEKILFEQDIYTNRPATDMRIAKVEHIFSMWTHIDGPRAYDKESPSGIPNRYALDLDFNSNFIWSQISNGAQIQTIIPESYNNRLQWFPNNWIRHYVPKVDPNQPNLSPFPSDMDPDIVSSILKKTTSAVNAQLMQSYPDPISLPERWQWRLPWISQTDWNGYRTRVNIKAIYNMREFFHNDHGAFSGVGNVNQPNDDSYKQAVSNPIPQLTDEKKLLYDLYTDLSSGRKLLFAPTDIFPDNIEVHNKNKYDSDEYFIAGTVNDTKNVNIRGADVSNVQNLTSKGIIFTENNQTRNAYQILNDYNFNTTRHRLWVNPKYEIPASSKNGTSYTFGSLIQVKNDILASKQSGNKVILDLHLSDTWTDPDKNIIPTSFLENDGSLPSVASLYISIYNYVYSTLVALDSQGALPEFVQIGNEINSNIMLSKPYADLTINQIAQEIGVSGSQMNGSKFTINWDRNADLLEAGQSAIDFFNSTTGKKVKSILHIAGARNAKSWIGEALGTERYNGIGTKTISKPDFFGISYYPGEENQNESILEVKDIIDEIYFKHNLQTIILETAYPKSYGYSDNTNNIQGSANSNLPQTTSIIKQKEWLKTLISNLHVSSGGAGVVYWEPFWVGSNDESEPMFDTVGSVWEHMSFFSFNNGSPQIVNALEQNGGISAFEELDTGGVNINNSQNICTEYTLDADPQSPNYINNGCWSVNEVNTNTTNLHNTPQFNSPQAWSAVSANPNNYVGMMFDQPSRIINVATKGRASTNVTQWVTLFELQGTKDGTNWQILGTYPANNDRNTPVVNQFFSQDADWIGARIKPITWNSHPSLRFQFTLCSLSTNSVICTPSSQPIASVIQNQSATQSNHSNFGAINDGNVTADAGVAMNSASHFMVLDLGQIYEPGTEIKMDIWGNGTSTRTVVNSEVPNGIYDPSNGTNQVTTQVNVNGSSSYTYTLASTTQYIQIKMTVRQGNRTEWVEATIINSCLSNNQNKSGNTDTKGSFDGDSELNLITFKDASVYPNPASNEFNLTFNAEEKDSYNIKITDIQGRIINTQDINVENLGQQFLRFKNNGELTTGTYLIILSNEHKTQTFKLIIK